MITRYYVFGKSLRETFINTFYPNQDRLIAVFTPGELTIKIERWEELDSTTQDDLDTAITAKGFEFDYDDDDSNMSAQSNRGGGNQTQLSSAQSSSTQQPSTKNNK